MKTSELIGQALDWAVSMTLGHRPEKDFHSHGMTWNGWWETAAYIDTKPNEYRRIPKYSTDWSQGGPIIERERISVVDVDGYDFWKADKLNKEAIPVISYGPTPLIAAMRAFVTNKFGAEIEIPEELK